MSDLVELARRFVSLSDELETVRGQIKLAVVNGSGGAEPERKANPMRPVRPGKAAAAEVEPYRRRSGGRAENCRLAAGVAGHGNGGDRQGDLEQDHHHDRALAALEDAQPDRPGGRRRLDRRKPHLTEAEIADLMSPSADGSVFGLAQADPAYYDRRWTCSPQQLHEVRLTLVRGDDGAHVREERTGYCSPGLGRGFIARALDVAAL